MESKKLVVDEGGNRRQTISAEDIKQALNDICEWFKNNATAYYKENLDGNTGSSEADVSGVLKEFGAAAGDCPSLRLALSKSNGGLHFLDTFKGLKL